MTISAKAYDTRQSNSYFEEIRATIPTGFTSAGRQRSGGLAFASAKGGHLTDVDGNDYVDLILGIGPVVIGHSEPAVVQALHEQLDRALILAAEAPGMLELVRRLHRWIPGADHMVFSNTGSEAVQMALRIARATTGRAKVVKFEGQYHGWLDPTHVNGHKVPLSDVGTAEVPTVPETPGQGDPSSVLVTRWNDINQLRSVIRAHPHEIAAVLMEPIPLGFGCFLPAERYLQDVRDLCTEEGVMLVFDEVVTGFRLGRAGAQGIYGVTPDISAFAKAIGGGVPLAMVTGTTKAMTPLLDGTLAHAGTFNASPFSIAAANAVTRFIDEVPDFYESLDWTATILQDGLRQVALRHDAPLTVNRVGSVLQLWWDMTGDGQSYRSCSTSNKEVIARLCQSMAPHGVFSHPRGLMFLAYRHTEADVERVLSAFADSLTGCLS